MITDRTQEDVNIARAILNKIKSGQALAPEEHAMYDAGLKGCYNVSDLNRVETKVSELSEVLNTYGYKNTVHVKTDWKPGDVIRYSDIFRYLQNIQILCDCFYTLPTTPPVPTISNWIDYVTANNIEQILVDIDAIIMTIQSDMLFCGNFHAGNDRDTQIFICEVI